jgi:very-short-patch-repair endonuclease
MIVAHPVDVLLRQGGTAHAADLVALCGRSAVRNAFAGGLPVRVRCRSPMRWPSPTPLSGSGSSRRPTSSPLHGGSKGRVGAACCGSRHTRTRAPSPPESVLRAVLLLAGIRGFDPQVVVCDEDFFARLDLGDAERRIAVEADSFEHHGHPSALVRDCRRYDELTVRGWRVLRFAWEHVMFDQTWVADTVTRTVEATRTRGRRSP